MFGTQFWFLNLIFIITLLIIFFLFSFLFFPTTHVPLPFFLLLPHHTYIPPHQRPIHCAIWFHLQSQLFLLICLQVDKTTHLKKISRSSSSHEVRHDLIETFIEQGRSLSRISGLLGSCFFSVFHLDFFVFFLFFNTNFYLLLKKKKKKKKKSSPFIFVQCYSRWVSVFSSVGLSFFFGLVVLLLVELDRF